jgi:FdhE protein
MTRDVWLASHPYLQRLAGLHAVVDAAADAIGVPRAGLPDWNEYIEDFHAGVPLLQSSKVAIDVSGLQDVVGALTDRLASSPLPVPPGDPGLRRYLESTVLVRYLKPVIPAFAAWRDEERWLRSYCPTCGSLPAMAQLIGDDPGRRRFLSCGCCGTRWRYARTSCPFCETESHRFTTITVEGEGGLRIDYCESCRAYLKTYDGQGSEAVLLADWTSLHLDLVAHDRGLKRRAASLYDFDPAAATAPVRETSVERPC